MNMRYLFLLIIFFFFVACKGKSSIETTYSYNNIVITRVDVQDMKTYFYYRDKNGYELGNICFFYKGRDEWFASDIVFGDDDKVYFVLSDANVKVTINDSSKFIVLHYPEGIEILKDIEMSRTCCVCRNIIYPVEQEINREYNSEVVIKCSGGYFQAIYQTI